MAVYAFLSRERRAMFTPDEELAVILDGGCCGGTGCC
jgi:hypothetical protein